MIKNKKGHIDARNVLSTWNFIKWIVDMIIILAGGGILAHRPSVAIFSLVFILWMWSLIKVIIDTPLVWIWAFGKYNHTKRRKVKRKRRKKK